MRREFRALSRGTHTCWVDFAPEGRQSERRVESTGRIRVRSLVIVFEVSRTSSTPLVRHSHALPPRRRRRAGRVAHAAGLASHLSCCRGADAGCAAHGRHGQDDQARRWEDVSEGGPDGEGALHRQAVGWHRLRLLARLPQAAVPVPDRCRRRHQGMGPGHAEDEQGREGDSHMHARLRMYARAHRTKRGPPCTRPTHPRRDNACRYLARQTASAARRPTSRPARPWSSTSSSLASAESPSSEPAGQTAGAQPRARRTRTRVVCGTYRPIFFIRRVCATGCAGSTRFSALDHFREPRGVPASAH